MQKYILKKRYILSLILILPVIFYQNCDQLDKLTESGEVQLSSSELYHQIHNDHDFMNIEKKPEPEIDYHPLLMNRKMLFSLFLDIFGPDIVNSNAIKTLRSDRSVFGVPCSIYENYDFKTATTRTFRFCSNEATTSHLGANINPQANVLRSGSIHKSCLEAIDRNYLKTGNNKSSDIDNKTFQFAMEQISSDAIVSGDPTKFTYKVPPASKENIQKLIELFYRGKPMANQSLVDSLAFVIGSPATSSGWKKAFINTCLSSHWQVL